MLFIIPKSMIDADKFPSPNQLLNKVLIKGKKDETN